MQVPFTVTCKVSSCMQRSLVCMVFPGDESVRGTTIYYRVHCFERTEVIGSRLLCPLVL